MDGLLMARKRLILRRKLIDPVKAFTDAVNRAVDLRVTLTKPPIDLPPDGLPIEHVRVVSRPGESRVYRTTYTLVEYSDLFAEEEFTFSTSGSVYRRINAGAYRSPSGSILRMSNPSHPVYRITRSSEEL
jgi:hypothetical protein